ncbi:MAG: hypothetical protein U0183_31015 [Polyangiaceae bacterium]
MTTLDVLRTSPRTTVWRALSALAFGMLASCTCSRGAPSSLDAAAPVAVDAGDGAVSALEMPKLSMPIGATLVPGGGVVVAGLSVPEKVVRVARVSRSGVVERRADVLAGAEWAHDAEISPHAVGSAVALVYRGKLEGQLQRVVVRLDDTLSAGPRRVFGTTTCATRDAVYWLEKKGVKAELAAGPRDLDLPGMDGDLGLFCDESRAFVTGDAEGVLSAVALSAEGAKTVLPIVGDKDFADEEREHAFFATASGLAVVRIGAEGALATKSPLEPKREAGLKLDDEEDLVLADADDTTLYLATTREHEGCAAGEDASALPTLRASRFSTSVHVVRLDLATGKATREDLGRAACGHQVSTFFFGKSGERRVLSWTERAPGSGKTKAPIDALAVRVLGKGLATVSQKIPLHADGLVDAGCDADGCVAVWLERPEAQDDRQPELPRILRFPQP